MKRRPQRPPSEKKSSISLPGDLWQQVKIACIERNTSFRNFMIEALQRELKRVGGSR